MEQQQRWRLAARFAGRPALVDEHAASGYLLMPARSEPCPRRVGKLTRVHEVISRYAVLRDHYILRGTTKSTKSTKKNAQRATEVTEPTEKRAEFSVHLEKQSAFGASLNAVFLGEL